MNLCGIEVFESGKGVSGCWRFESVIDELNCVLIEYGLVYLDLWKKWYVY